MFGWMEKWEDGIEERKMKIFLGLVWLKWGRIDSTNPLFLSSQMGRKSGRENVAYIEFTILSILITIFAILI